MEEQHEEDVVVQTLCSIQQCFVFRLPPRTSSTGYRAADWKDNQVWTGRLRIQMVGGKHGAIQLLEDDGRIFAVCPLKEGAVEKVTDSSRYFVLRVENGQGKKAYIGIGFSDRSEAFDFNAGLQDWEKYRDGGEMSEDKLAAAAEKLPAKDLSLKQGQTIHVKVKTSKKDKSPTEKATSSALKDSLGMSIAPPPAAENSRKSRRTKVKATTAT